MTDGMNPQSFPVPGGEPQSERPSIRRPVPAADAAVSPPAAPAADAPVSPPAAPAASVEAAAPSGRPLVSEFEAIGQVVEVGGSGAQVEILGRRLTELADDPDPSVAMSGQVGSQ